MRRSLLVVVLFPSAATIWLALTVDVEAAAANDRILFNSNGPSAVELYIANADGTGEQKLLATSALDYSPSFSRDGHWIVFTSERGGSADIYRIRPDRSGLERLTDDPAFDDQAALSPDGTRLAFVSTRGAGTADIWILDLNTRELRNLTRGAGGNFRPSWSPDGRWIAFSSDRDGSVRRRSSTDFEQVQEASVYVVQPEGGAVRRLTPAGVFAGSPTWSADGARVAFYEMTVDNAFDARFGDFRPNSVSQIVSIEVSSSVRTAITSGPGLKVAPQFALDDVAYLLKNGDRSALAFARRGSGATGSMRNPAWSPDGKSVVYQKLSNAPRPQNQAFFSRDAKFELASSSMFPAFSRRGKLVVTTDFNGADYASLTVMDADGSHARKLVDEPRAMAFAATWSPDGEQIAFGFGGFFANGTLPARIMMMRADGTDRRALTNGPANAGFPSFSDSGGQIVYRVAGENERGLRILSLKDGSIETLTTEPDNFPAWSPAGGLIEFTRAIDGAYDIFSVRPDGTNLRRLTMAPGNDAHGVWSPDGNHIVFSSARLGFRDESPLYDPPEFQPYGELFIMNVDGSDQRPLTDNRDEEATPAWQPAPAAH